MLVFEEQLYNALKAGTALTTALGGTHIYNAMANKGSATTYPYVIFTKSSGVEDTSSPHRAKTLIYQVTGISATSKKEAEQLDNYCDALVHNGTYTVTGWGVYWSKRQSDVSYSEDISGKILWHEGGLYRIEIAE